MSTVTFKNASYDENVLRPLVFELLESGLRDRIAPGARVLIKPNLLLPTRVETAILTHPLMLKAVAEYALDKGGKVVISDSPALGTIEKIFRKGGFESALKGLDVEVRPFDTVVGKDIGPPFGVIDMAKGAFEADVVINLPKLKTHTQMLLTLGVKNLFGTIVGFKKTEWHMRCNIDREMFARLLVRICHAVAPDYTLIDGIDALEGEGPGKSGTPRHVGVIAGSKNVYALDAAVCDMLGIYPHRLLTLKMAREIGVYNGQYKIHGDFRRVSGFRLPILGPLTYGPKAFQRFMRRHMFQRPVPDPSKCRLCGDCVRFCPAGAITKNEKHLHFDYDTCIRCYCCVEICPYGALFTEETVPGRIMRGISDFLTQTRGRIHKT